MSLLLEIGLSNININFSVLFKEIQYNTFFPWRPLWGRGHIYFFFIIKDKTFKHNINIFIFIKDIFQNLCISENIHRNKQLFKLVKVFVCIEYGRRGSKIKNHHGKMAQKKSENVRIFAHFSFLLNQLFSTFLLQIFFILILLETTNQEKKKLQNTLLWHISIGLIILQGPRSVCFNRWYQIFRPSKRNFSPHQKTSLKCFKQ